MRARNSKSGAWHRRIRRGLLLTQRSRLALLAVVCVLSVFFADRFSLLSGIAYAVVLLLSYVSSRRVFFISIVLSLLCGALHLQRLHRESNLRDQLIATRSFAGTFQIISPPRESSGGWSATAIFDEKKIEVTGRTNAPRAGDILTATAEITKWQGPRNLGEFDRPEWLKRNGILATMRLSNAANDPQNFHRIYRLLDDMRLGLRQAITAGIPESSAEAIVIRAMVLGEQPPREDELLIPFIHSGTMHLFSVSGQHVSMVALILWIGMSLLRIPRKYAVLLLIPAVFLYAYVTGGSPPAIRAAWMAAVFLMAFWFQRQPNLLGALSIVMITALLLNSHLIFLPGVQLSYGVVAAISLGLSLCHRRIERWSLLDDYIPRELYTPQQERIVKGKTFIAQSIAVSTSACLGSAPLGILHFGLFTPVSVIANLIMTPFVGLLLSLSVISATLHPIFPKAAIFVNQSNIFFARSCIRISEICAALPGASRRHSVNRPRHDAIHIFDLPRGNGATIFQTENADVLLDAGSKRAGKTISSSLQYLGAAPSTLLLSHPESGHIGYATELLAAFPVKKIIAPVAKSRARSFQALIAEAKSRQIPVYLAQPTILRLSEGVSCQMIPTTGCADRSLAADDRICLHCVDFHGYRILFAHDAAPAELQNLWPSLPSIDVLILGRHELHSWPIDAWPSRPPRLIIASHSDFPAGEILPAEWKKFVESAGIQVISQQQTGMISLHVSNDGVLHFQGFLDGIFHLTRRLPE